MLPISECRLAKEYIRSEYFCESEFAESTRLDKAEIKSDRDPIPDR